MDDIVIVSAARTPVGSFNGALSTIHAQNLGAKLFELGADHHGLAFPFHPRTDVIDVPVSFRVGLATDGE